MGLAGAPCRAAVTENALADRIARRIRREGPLSLAAYMAMALHEPDLGYYATRRPIGSAGDFVTAPEISQVFGELIGLWCALVWEQVGRPDSVILAELGPGSGVLASDLLRAAGALPDFRRSLRLHLVETSPVLRTEQQRRLAFAQPVWVDRIEELPEGPILIIANEFLDALPIRQLVRGRRHWSERMVAIDGEGRLVLADGPENPALSLPVPEALRDTARPGAVFEFCPSALALAATFGARLQRDPGAALFIDYGYFPGRSGSTLRALSHHQPVDPLMSPGSADLSAHVDFAAFADAARAAGCGVCGPVPQGGFLELLGARERLAALSQRANSAQRLQLESGVERLLDPGQMGDLFKALALASPWLTTPLGFDFAEQQP
jgi:NADH dehydrogenase [ubiquinone] 1 alpha subcomplex assembly factor 7